METLGHATPDEVYAEVRTHSESINLSTVYRTLELLDDLGLIRHAHLTDRAPTYHSARGHEHAHLVCRVCHRVISIGRAEIEDALGPLAARHDFTPDYGHLTVFGTCRGLLRGLIAQMARQTRTIRPLRPAVAWQSGTKTDKWVYIREMRSPCRSAIVVAALLAVMVSARASVGTPCPGHTDLLRGGVQDVPDPELAPGHPCHVLRDLLVDP